ncbi:MAG: hypothetical protein HYZ49_05700 [Chloroflexi bacterium]|nr:hypothetical protein [Chloroflexota bacterium]
MRRLLIVLMSMIVALAGSGIGPAHAEILKRPIQLLVAPSGGTVTVRWFWSTADNNQVIIRRNGVTVFTEAINNAWGNRGSVGIWSTAVNAGDSVTVTAAVVARTLPPTPGGLCNSNGVPFSGPPAEGLCIEDAADNDYDDLRYGIYFTPLPDTTPPTTTASVTGTAGSNGWYISPATLSLSAVDNGGPGPASGLNRTYLNSALYTGPVNVTAEGTTAFSFYSVDNRGNVEPTKSTSVKVDTVPPSTSPSLSGAMGNAGWYIGDVTLTLTATDAASGVASTTLDGSPYSGPVTFSTQGVSNHSYFSADNAGNFEPAQALSLKIDSAPPVVTPAIAGPAGNGGWYLGPVTLSLAASDTASGVASLLLDGSPYSGAATIADEGATTHLYQATDVAGNAASGSATIQIDLTPPTVAYLLSGTIGDDGWYVSPVTATLAASDSASGIGSLTLDGSAYTGPIAISTQGDSLHAYDATDVAGNTSSSQSFSLKIDTIPPTSSLTSHGVGQAVSGTVTLSGSASDATSGLARVDISIDNGATWNAATVNGGLWSYLLNTTSLSDSPLTVSVRARDVAGNVQPDSGAGSTSVALLVDNTVPEAALSAPPSFCPLCGETAALTYSVGDATSGIASWTLTVAGGPTLASGSSPASASFAWDGAGLAAGPYTVRLTATDTAGNTVERSETIAITLPGSPVASIELACSLPGDDGWCKAPVTVILRGQVNGISIVRLNYLYEDDLKIANGGTFSFDEGRPGEHVVRLTATDSLGRVSPQVAGAFKVDGAPPSIVFNGGTDSALAIEIADATSGVARWAVQVFDESGQSVFWREGSGELKNLSSWSAPADGTYYLSVFARDAAGHEISLEHVPFSVDVPAAVEVVRDVLLLLLPHTPTPTAIASSPTPHPTATRPTPTPTREATAIAAVQPPSVPVAPALVPVIGVVFHDVNGDGVQNAGEAGLGNVTIEIVAGGETTSLVTDSTGAYHLMLPGGGRYRLRVVAPGATWFATTSSEQTLLLDRVGGQGTAIPFGLNRREVALTVTLLVLLAAVLAWLASAAFDRRPAALHSLAGELQMLTQSRLQGDGIAGWRRRWGQ